jgi:hypothetical protein
MAELEKIFEPEVLAPEGAFEPELQFLIEQIAESGEALSYYTEVKGATEMDQHTTIVVREAISALSAALGFLRQLQEYEHGRSKAARRGLRKKTRREAGKPHAPGR